MAHPKNSATMKHPMKTRSEKQDVTQSHPRVESGIPREPEPNPLNSQQTSNTLEKFADHVNLLTNAVQSLATNFSKCADHLKSLTNRTEKVEKYLSGFESTFITFQKILEQRTASQLQNLEQRINDNLESYSESLKASLQKPCNCVCRTQKETTPTSPTTLPSPETPNQPSINSQDLKNLLDHLQKSTENEASRKQEEDAKQQAHLIKREILADWTDALNQRKRGYWNYILNKNKRSLYSEWQQEDPSFLPMKFRPKFSNTLDPQVLELRRMGAFDDYKRNVEEMKIYEEKHQKKFQSIDQQMKEKILGLSSNRLATQEAQNLWLKDTAEQEARSIQLWNKKERFLRRKKHEETIPSSAVPSYSEINYFLSSSDEESC